MSKDQWPAPAKLNLFLHILGRRKDGYHQLQTVFQLLEFGDELTFRLRNDGVISLAGNYTEIRPEQDLIYRAALLLQQHSGTDQGVDIRVVKRIPLGGGLGGGSSDAASTLVALNQLWGAGLNTATLTQLGLGLGADVPVFIQGYSAWAEGIGEKLTPITLPEQWFLLIHPGCHVSTARIFNTPDLTRNTSPITIRDFLDGAGHNDCKKVVFREFPEVAGAAAWLDQWTEAKLTGTGACIFGQFATQQAALDVLAKLPKTWQGFVSKGINVSPLQVKLGNTDT
jgi:4-diphosphocytidyl-2-C-methyl-D-erythritol kinase